MYLLDTNILSEIVKKRPNPNLLSRLRSSTSQELFTSCICVMELRFGSKLRDDFEDFWNKLNKEIISRVNVLPVGEKEAIIAGDILADLKKRGKITGIEDVLIAASAKTNKCALVTANIRHFSRIRDLVVENWIEAV